MSKDMEPTIATLLIDNLAMIVSFLVGAGAAVVKLMLGRISDAVARNTEAVEALSSKIDGIVEQNNKLHTRVTIIEEKLKNP